MAPSSVPQSLRLYVAGIGGSPAGRETQLVESMRSRFSAKYSATASTKELIAIYIYGVEPVVK